MHARAREKPPKNACQLTQHHSENVANARTTVGKANPGTLIKSLPGALLVFSDKIEVGVSMSVSIFRKHVHQYVGLFLRIEFGRSCVDIVHLQCGVPLLESIDCFLPHNFIC